MDFVGIVMFAMLVALCVFFIVCGIQFGRGKWLGLLSNKSPHPQRRILPRRTGMREKRNAPRSVRKKSALLLGRAFRMSCSPQLSHRFADYESGAYVRGYSAFRDNHVCPYVRFLHWRFLPPFPHDSKDSEALGERRSKGRSANVMRLARHEGLRTLFL